MKLRLVKQGDFLGTKCDFYVDDDNNIYMSRTQIGYALQYKDPSNAIKNIHARHYKRLDNFSVEVTTAQIERVSKHQSKDKITFMYTAQGIFEICRHSNQPHADDFYDYVYGVVIEIMQNGFYIASGKDEKWLGIRQETKQVRKNETDMIQKFVDYVISQGSQNDNRLVEFDKKQIICLEFGEKDNYNTIKRIQKFEGEGYSFKMEVKIPFCKKCGSYVYVDKIEEDIIKMEHEK